MGSKAAAPRVMALARGIYLPIGGRVWGGGCAPSRENLLDLCLKMAHFGCIFAIRKIFSQFKGGAWPKWLNGKYATAVFCSTLYSGSRNFAGYIEFFAVFIAWKDLSHDALCFAHWTFDVSVITCYFCCTTSFHP